MEENDPLEMTLQKERKIVKFNNYSTDVLVRLIKVDLDTSNFNCDKIDFTSQPAFNVDLESSLNFGSKKSPEKIFTDT